MAPLHTHPPRYASPLVAHNVDSCGSTCALLLGVFPLVGSLVTGMHTPLHSFVVLSALGHHSVRHPNGAARESVASEPCSTRNIQQNFDSCFTTSVDRKACWYGAHRALPLEVQSPAAPQYVDTASASNARAYAWVMVCCRGATLCRCPRPGGETWWPYRAT